MFYIAKNKERYKKLSVEDKFFLHAISLFDLKRERFNNVTNTLEWEQWILNVTRIKDVEKLRRFCQKDECKLFIRKSLADEHRTLRSGDISKNRVFIGVRKRQVRTENRVSLNEWFYYPSNEEFQQVDLIIWSLLKYLNKKIKREGRKSFEVSYNYFEREWGLSYREVRESYSRLEKAHLIKVFNNQCITYKKIGEIKYIQNGIEYKEEIIKPRRDCTVIRILNSAWKLYDKISKEEKFEIDKHLSDLHLKQWTPYNRARWNFWLFLKYRMRTSYPGNFPGETYSSKAKSLMRWWNRDQEEERVRGEKRIFYAEDLYKDPYFYRNTDRPFCEIYESKGFQWNGEGEAYLSLEHKNTSSRTRCGERHSNHLQFSIY